MKTWAYIILALTFLGCSRAAHKSESYRTIANTPEAHLSEQLSRISPAAVCDAVSIDTGRTLGKADLRVESSDEPLILISSKSLPQLNFKIGRRFSAGTDYSANSKMECKYVQMDDEQVLSFIYLCGRSPLPDAYSEIREHMIKSSFSYPLDATWFRVCKNSATCVDLKNCAQP